MSDDDRDAILARRRMFIAAALAGGATVAAGAVGLGAYAVLAPCLSPVPTTTSPFGASTPCLTPVTVTLDAGPADAGVDAPDAGEDAELERTPPRPCLSVRRREPRREAPGPDPLPCLSPPRR